MTKAERLKFEIEKFRHSPQRAMDFQQLLLVGSQVLRQGDGLGGMEFSKAIFEALGEEMPEEDEPDKRAGAVSKTV